MPVQTQVLTYSDIQIKADTLNEKIIRNKEELLEVIGDKTSAIGSELSYVHERTYDLEERINRLEANLRSVLDAQAEKPKQKWLWEIFEPNDLNIDFPYNI